MADKRMFSKTIVEKDDFLDMPDSTKVLYFYLCMAADDDGFCGAPRRVMRSCGANDDDMRVLIQKRFVISFPEGVVVIRHWKVHNYIAKDRYHASEYTKMYKELYIDNGVYEISEPSCTECIQPVHKSYTDCTQDVSEPYTEDRLDKDRVSIENTPNNITRINFNKNKFGLFNNVSLSEEEYGLLTTKYPSYYEKYINKLSSYMASTGKAYASHYATIISWLEKDRIEPVTIMTEEEQMEAHRKTMEEFERLMGQI